VDVVGTSRRIREADMAEHSEWPMRAEIDFLTDEGEWQHYAEISSVEHAEEWIAKRTDPERWRAVPRERASAE
jgi:hypothetical protein